MLKPTVPVLAPHALHCWRAPLALAPAARQCCEATLDDNERRRAALFASAALRERWVAARGQTRMLLAAYAGIPAAAVRFTHGAHGKPALVTQAHGTALHFNLSHSGAELLLGVGRAALGVDLEWVAPELDIDAMLPVCTAAERDYIAADPLPRFYRCWTRKEARLKAGGEGLGGALHLLDTTGPRLDGWELHSWSADGYMLAVAARPGSVLTHHRFA